MLYGVAVKRSSCICPVGGPQAPSDSEAASDSPVGYDRLQQPSGVAQQATSKITQIHLGVFIVHCS